MAVAEKMAARAGAARIPASAVGVPQSTRRMSRRHFTPSGMVAPLVDTVVMLFLLVGFTYRRFGMFPDPYLNLMVISSVAMWFSYHRFGIYRRQSTVLEKAILRARAWALTVALVIAAAFVTKTSAVYSREAMILWSVAVFPVQTGIHLLWLRASERFKHDQPHAHALVIGATTLGRYIAERINDNPWLSTTVVGVVDGSAQRSRQWAAGSVPVLGSPDELDRLIDEHDVRSIYIALPMSEANSIEELYLRTLDRNLDVNWVPDIFGLTLVNPSIKEIGGAPIITLSETPLIGMRRITKEVTDRVLASCALLLAAPLLLTVAALIKLDSPGPVFFRQLRHGWDGRPFRIYKFRSMYHGNREVYGIRQATRDDPRVTRIGRWIRRTSIDEVPQLIDVVLGRMSLVGPRPHPLTFGEVYGHRIRSYMARHRIKPGMTGLAQVAGLRGETPTLESMQARIELDLYYINNWSLWMDLRILFRTLFVLMSKNAY